MAFEACASIPSICKPASKHAVIVVQFYSNTIYIYPNEDNTDLGGGGVAPSLSNNIIETKFLHERDHPFLILHRTELYIYKYRELSTRPGIELVLRL